MYFPMRCMPITYILVRCAPVNYTPMRCTPMRYKPVRCTLCEAHAHETLKRYPYEAPL
jgi:hypothetical protein